MMMNVLTSLLVCSVVTMAAATQTECNISALFSQLTKGSLSLKEYTALFRRCTSGKGTIYRPAESKYGYQPSCSASTKVTQAVAKFDSKGTFPAKNGSEYPYWVRGVVTFSEIDSKRMRIHATIVGTHSFLFDSKFFSLHVHQKGEINPSCSATGGHYNPCKRNHSNDPKAEDRHVGDVAHVIIPPHFSSAKDVLTFEMIDTQVKLSGPLSVLGRSVTVHGGSASTRVGCGTIAVTEWEGDHHAESHITTTPDSYRI